MKSRKTKNKKTKKIYFGSSMIGLKANILEKKTNYILIGVF
jgi:hypothetical protein